jgi:hypothetical protein
MKNNLNQRPKAAQKIIYSGIPWFDDRGDTVNAHGACIVFENGRYYLVGEYKTNDINHFVGFSCYSSDDLVYWRFEGITLPRQASGFLGPDRIGERPKVIKCPMTGKFIMLMHTDDKGYNDPHIGYAVSDSITGEYEFRGSLLYNGNDIKRWDMGAFQDEDGTGYLLIHHGPIYRLSEDYCSVVSQAADVAGMGESPAMSKKDGIYFLLTSNLTSWERNDNFYFTAEKIEGPWINCGLFAPQRSLTHNSQCTFVIPIKSPAGTTYMYMGDRWSYPRQGMAATYVWQPMAVKGTTLSIAEFWEGWDFETKQKVELFQGGISIGTDSIMLEKKTDWKRTEDRLVSNVKGSKLEAEFRGTQIAIFGETNHHSGYAKITIRKKTNEEVFSTFVDFYSLVDNQGIRFISPALSIDDYILVVEVTGEFSFWTDKKASIKYGSDDYFITIYNIQYRTE